MQCHISSLPKGNNYEKVFVLRKEKKHGKYFFTHSPTLIFTLIYFLIIIVQGGEMLIVLRCVNVFSGKNIKIL